MIKYGKVAVGGTFDQLHRGHKALLDKAFEVGEKVVIGLTSDEFVAKMAKPHRTAPYVERLRALKAYLAKRGLAERAEIVALNDPLGLTVSGKGLEAIVVSEETAKIAQSINQKRLAAGLVPLEIVTVAMVPAENHTPISTTRIRSGEINRNGRLLKQTG
ncbi:MAG: phosphopantetheine adenylyltransferase [Candidatus Bathyarchaeota archaeon]|nr:phosphopantetheine adenylyltransferase [Candidatus Bathyarchaeota archaeon]